MQEAQPQCFNVYFSRRLGIAMQDNRPTETELEQLTVQHWDSTSTDLQWYIQNLLPKEVLFSGQQQDPCDVLVLLIGFSPDPLLQSVWKYQPQRTVLLLNQRYGSDWGSQRAARYGEWIESMVKQGLCSSEALPDEDRNDIAVCEKEASPDWVFCEMRDRLLNDQKAGKRIVVDITGAKKNMAAGAFLFAAHAGVEISYVDFDKYDEHKRRPKGYTCRIALQPNPYSILGLRDWERVRQLFDQFAFRNAATEIGRLEQEMRTGLASKAGAGKYFTESQCDAVTCLHDVLNMLECWDNGDFTAAWKHWTEPTNGRPALQSRTERLALPQAVEILGATDWPSVQTDNAKSLFDQHRALKRGVNKPEESIFNEPEKLLIYAYDELDKIDRLIRFNNDYRSAFLRSAGLDELLLKARVAILWFKPSALLPTWPNMRERFNGIADHSSADKLRDFLLGTRTNDLPVQYWDSTLGKKANFELKRSYSSVAEQLVDYWKGLTLDHETLVDLRGEAIHTHLSIPRPIAEDAYRIACCALNDFVLKWAPLLGKPWSPYQKWDMTWEQLCEHCHIDFLPALPKPKEKTHDQIPVSC